MRRITVLVMAVGLLALAGCGSVASVNKLGGPLDDEKVAAKFDGVWSGDDGRCVHIKHLGGGELVAAGLRWNKDAGQFEKTELRAWLSTDDGATYVNVLEESERWGGEVGPDQPRYSHLRCAVHEDRLILFGTKPEYFAQAVEDGRLEGAVKRGEHNEVHVLITGDAAKLNELVHPDRIGEQFNVDNPVVLRKITNDL